MTDPASTNRPSDQGPGGQAGDALAGQPARAAGPASVEDQPTVISRRPPMPAGVVSGLLPEIRPGTTLGHFQLLEHIGGGGMGQVYRALDMRLGRTVALKVLAPEQAADEETLLRFRNEARSAARLNHDGIAQVYYIGEDRGAAFIAFEYVDGINIRDLVAQKGPLPLGEALALTLQVAEALAHASARNVVHRDIKPSNVLITPEGKVKLIDLGLARMQPLSGSGSDLTASGVTLGTFDYISPEQARDPRNADVRSDIYSLGCTLFYMLAGQPPFPEGTVLQKLLQHQGDEPPDIRTFRPELPEAVSYVLRRMMAKTPERRYQSAEQLIDALVGLSQRLGIRLAGRGQLRWVFAEQRRPSPIRRHLPWAVPVLALLAVVSALHALWSAQSGVPAAPHRPIDAPPAGWETPLFQEEQVAEPPSPPAQPSDKTASGDAGPGPPGTASERASPVQSELPSPAQHAEGPGEGQPVRTGEPVSQHPSNPDRAGRSFGDEPPGSGLPSEQQSKTPATGTAARRSARPTGQETANAGRADNQGAIEQRRVLIVDPADPTGEAFGSLGAALAEAADGDVIELRYNGVNQREDAPPILGGLRVTIRGGSGFQPVLRYKPEPNAIVYSPGMFSLAGSQITFEQLALELDVPAEMTAEEWSMFEMGPGDQIALRRCWLTIRNRSAHPEVAFLRAKTPLADSLLRRNASPASRPATRVELRDCVVRGQATLLCVEDPAAVELAWYNGLLVTTQQLIRAEGIDRPAALGEGLRVELNHVTAVVLGGLARWVATAANPFHLPAQIISSDCVFEGNGANPLGLQETAGTPDAALANIQWYGRSNTYSGFGSFWVIQPIDMQGEPTTWSLAEWVERVGLEAEIEPHWVERPSHSWPVGEKAVDEHTAGDYAAGRSGRPGGESTPDMDGFIYDQLPPAPAEPAETTGQSEHSSAGAPQ